MSLLEAEALRKVYRRRRFRRVVSEHYAVDDVSLVVERGRTVAIVGESGAGKSTLARLVTRLVAPDSGTVRFEGLDLGALDPRELRQARRGFQMVFQDPHSSFDPRIRIGPSIAEPLKVHSDLCRADRERVTVELLERVGLRRDLVHRFPHQLSGGQLQRVAIARALSLRPSLIVCDEAVAALDVSVRAQVLNLLLDLQEERGVSYLFIAHDLSIVEVIADEIVVMQRGRVVEQGPSKQIYTQPVAEYTRELLAAVPVADPRARRRANAGRSRTPRRRAAEG